MSKVDLPPQAYTHEVLASAFNWLKSQPEKVRELAKTSDDLVALYLQARRHRPLPKEKPTSAKNFSNELKSLAQGLKQFEGENTGDVRSKADSVGEPRFDFDAALKAQNQHQDVSSQSRISSEVSTQSRHSSEQGSQSRHISQEPPPQKQNEQHHGNPNYTGASPTSFNPESAKQPIGYFDSPEKIHLDGLDMRSRTLIKEVQQRMNLSSEIEAIRLLIVLGYEKARDLFPRP